MLGLTSIDQPLTLVSGVGKKLFIVLVKEP